MVSDEIYGEKYFEGIYAHLKKEKKLILKSFFDLLFLEKKGIKNILDLGCGEGDFLTICQKAGVEGCGVDISSYALGKARIKFRGELKKLDLEKERLPWPDDFFEAVTAFDLVEHLRNTDILFSEAHRILKKGGIFFLTTPNAGFFLAKLLGRIIPGGDSTHVNLQRKKDWLRQLEKAGFSKVEVKGCLLFGFPPGLDCRHCLRKLKWPVLTKPIFFFIKGLTSELFIFARK